MPRSSRPISADSSAALAPEARLPASPRSPRSLCRVSMRRPSPAYQTIRRCAANSESPMRAPPTGFTRSASPGAAGKGSRRSALRRNGPVGEHRPQGPHLSGRRLPRAARAAGFDPDRPGGHPPRISPSVHGSLPHATDSSPCWSPASPSRATSGSRSSAALTGRRDRIQLWSGSVTSQTFRFMPATTRP
jgi:hypothetical protein